MVALSYVAVVEEPARFARSRFARSKALGPALGLTPSRYQSGETDRRGAITKSGDRRARVALFEAAHVMMTRVARWFPLKAWAMRVAARRGAKRAKVALARRLAVILHRMWVDGTDFQAQPAWEEPGEDDGRGQAAGHFGHQDAVFEMGSPRRSRSHQVNVAQC